MTDNLPWRVVSVGPQGTTVAERSLPESIGQVWDLAIADPHVTMATLLDGMTGTWVVKRTWRRT